MDTYGCIAYAHTHTHTHTHLNETLTKIYKLTTELEIYFNNNYLNLIN